MDSEAVIDVSSVDERVGSSDKLLESENEIDEDDEIEISFVTDTVSVASILYEFDEETESVILRDSVSEYASVKLLDIVREIELLSDCSVLSLTDIVSSWEEDFDIESVELLSPPLAESDSSPELERDTLRDSETERTFESVSETEIESLGVKLTLSDSLSESSSERENDPDNERLREMEEDLESETDSDISSDTEIDEKDSEIEIFRNLFRDSDIVFPLTQSSL